jgi:hypothetical protein
MKPTFFFVIVQLFLLWGAAVCHAGNYGRTMLAEPAGQWFFRAVYGYPVSVSFEPLVLFENGDYFEVGTVPVEELDMEESKRNEPKSWGTWRLENGVYYLTNSKGKTSDYQLGSGNWFPAFPYDGSVTLKSRYVNTTGTTLPTGTTLMISEISFLDGKHFTEGENMGALAPNSAAWKQSKHTGTYQLSGHTLILKFEDGREERRSFAIGAKGNPAKATADMIFIGGDTYIDQD